MRAFVFHEELHRVATGTAREALVAVLCRIDREVAERVVIMERTKANVFHTALFEREEVADDIHDICRFLDLGFCNSVDVSRHSFIVR